MDKIIGQVLRESTREWLRVLLSHVPVETGMARATLIPIGQYLNNVGGLLFTPTRKPYYSNLEGGIQDIGLGLERQEFKIVDTAIGSWKYTVFWDSGTHHYWENEFYRGDALPGEAAEIEAEGVFFLYFFQTIDRRLPPLGPFLS